MANEGVEVKVRKREIEYFFMGSFGLIGEKQVAGVIEDDEFCAGNSIGDQLSVFRRHERIRLTVDDKGRRGNLGESAVALPGKNGLQLCGVTFEGGKPASTECEIFVDLLGRSGAVINEGEDGLP